MTKSSKPAIECGGKAKRDAAFLFTQDRRRVSLAAVLQSFDFYIPDLYPPLLSESLLSFGFWNLEHLWDLDFEVWKLEFGISLELGAWSLELS
jgi:hypothetical protein